MVEVGNDQSFREAKGHRREPNRKVDHNRPSPETPLKFDLSESSPSVFLHPIQNRFNCPKKGTFANTRS